MDENLETFAYAKAEGAKAKCLISQAKGQIISLYRDTFVSGCAHVWASNFIYPTVLKQKG